MQTTTQLELLYAVGSQVPKTVKSMGKSLSRLPSDESSKTIQCLIDLCLDYLANGGKTITRDKYEKAIEMTCTNGGLNRDNFDQLFAGIYSMIRALIRVPLSSTNKNQVINAKLLSDELKMDAAHCQMIMDAAQRSRPTSNLTAWKLTPQLSGMVARPRLLSIDWRVDVSISSNLINRIMEPTVIIKLVLEASDPSSDKVHISFESSLAQFSKLRYVVARMLSEFNAIESKSILSQSHKR